MCATSHPLAAQVAVNILKRGGNAMDAAIAGAVLLGFCEPQSTGIGGDCFVLWNRSGCHDVQALNGSGRAPAQISANDLRHSGLTMVPHDSPHSVTIPTAIEAFCYLSEHEGKLGIDALLAPSIHYAEHGIPVAPRVAFDWNRMTHRLHGCAKDAYLVQNRAPSVGDIFRSPEQAEVLRYIAKQGRDGFYTGDVAEDLVQSLQNLGGTHTLDDFAQTECMPTRPISGTYDETEIMEHPPNGQGATAILMLNILKHFDLAELDPLGHERAHIEAEAAKLAYQERDRIIADPDHSEDIDTILSSDTASQLADKINPKRAGFVNQPVNETRSKDTVYICVVDKDRMSVSLIYSIYYAFGSGMASERFKILFQNRGAGFSLEAGHPNEIAPRKRPLHTIIPAMLRANSKIMMPFGVMGGAYQPNGHVRFLCNMCDYGMDPQEAIDAPRTFADEGKLLVEQGYSNDVCQKLTNFGHTVARPESPIGGAQAIKIHANGTLEGASDPRKDGCALGY